MTSVRRDGRKNSARIDDLGDVAEFDGGIVSVGHDEIAILRGVAGLTIRVNLIAEIVVLDGALRAVGVGRGQGRADVFQADAILEHRARVQLHAHARQCAPAHGDLADAVELRQSLLQDVGSDVIELTEGARARSQHEDHYARAGRVGLVIGRILAQAGRQVRPRRIDRRLDVARR